MKKETIVSNTMREFKEGKLRSSSGDKVTDRDQAIAIALSKSGQSKFDEGSSVDDIADAIKGAKTLLKFASASDKKEIETFIKGLEILKKMSGDSKSSKTVKKPSKNSESKYTLEEAKKFFIESGKIDEVSPDVERLIRALIDQDKSPIRTEDELYAEKSLLPNITNWSEDWKYHITNLISLSKIKKGEFPKLEKRYTYALTIRPFDIGTYPKENFVRFVYEEEDNYKFGLLEYSEPIPDRDLKHFSLAPVSELNQYNEKLFDYFDGNIGQAFIKKTLGNIPYVKVDLYDDPNEEAIETIDLSGQEFLSKIKSGDYKILENQSKIKDTDGENNFKKKQSLENIKNQIIDFVEKNSWFRLDDDSDDFMLFATRENGNVGSESPGSKDIAEAKRLKQEIEKKFKGLVKIELEVVDEWVHININIKESNSSPESSKTESNKEIDYKKVIADKLSVSEEKAEKIISFFRYSKEYYEKYKNTDPKKYNNSFRVYADNYIKYKDSSKINHAFNSAKEVFDYIQSSDFKESFYRNANPINKVQVGLYGWDSLTLKLNKNSFPYDSNEETDYRAVRTITLSAYPFGMVNIYDSKDFTKKLEKIISDFISSYKIYVLNENKFESGGVIGQEIVFDDNGEENKGVIKDIHEITGDYIVSTDDGRTVLASKELDVIRLGNIRKKPLEAVRKRFGFFENGGIIDYKKKQLDIINKTNPAPNNINTWIRSVDDIKTAEEVFSVAFEEGAMYPDFQIEDMQEALDNGFVTIYSSYPIKPGVFVTPSAMNAADYAGGNRDKIHSKKVKINEVAWIDESEGQYAPINRFDNGGSISKNYEIVEGFDHFKNIPLYRVTDRDEYVGEWHTDLRVAENERSELNDTRIFVYSDMDSDTGIIAEIQNKKFDSIESAKQYAKSKGYPIEVVEMNYSRFESGGSVKSDTRLGEKYLYVPYGNSPYTITGKLRMGQKWLLTNDKNPNEYHALNDFEIEQWIKSGKLKPVNSKFNDGGNVRGMDWYQMWQPKRNKLVKVGDIVLHKNSKQPYKVIELLDDQYTVAKMDGNKEIEWKTFYEDFQDHNMFIA